MVTFVIFQWGRTPAAGEVMDAIATKTARALLKASGLVPENMRTDIDSLTVRYKSSVTNSLKLAATMHPMLFDLTTKVLVNKTDVEFLASDAPVVLFNQWCQGTHGMGTTGLASAGLQLFLPVSSRHLVLMYDGSIYSVGKRSSPTVDIATMHDVTGLNGLQLLTAEENLYYTGGSRTAEAIEHLPFRWRGTRAESVEVERAIEENGRSQLMHLYQRPSDARIDLSFMRVIRRMRDVPPEARVRQHRQAALEADEIMRGPLASRYAAPSGPKTWRVVDD